VASLGRTAEVLRSALASELSAGAEIPFATKLKLWRAGFKSASYRLFDLAHNDPRDYVSDLAISKARGVNGAFGRILKDKLLFAPMLAPYARVPEVLGVVERGRVYPLSAPDSRVLNSVDALLALCAERAVILKPSKGNKGKGVLSLSVLGAQLLLNGQTTTPEEVARTVRGLDGYLIVERVQQAAYAEAIFPGSANTIRIVTMQDPDTGEVFIPVAIHRFGTTSTGPTDNFQTGGVSVAIDLETGTLGRAVRFPTHTGGELRWLEAHPDTQAPIQGVVVPRWAEVRETVMRIVETYRFLKYVGWDVLITDSEIVLIEGNHNINLGLQVHGPLLRNPRARRFFEHYKVVPTR
jgi:hypothetical protein